MSNYWTEETERYDPAATAQAEEIAKAAAAHWRSEALTEYPAVVPLAEYLNGGSRDEVMNLARDLADKLGSAGGHASPSPGGSPALDGGGAYHPGENAQDMDDVAIAREEVRRNPSEANHSKYLRAKFAAAGMPYPGDD